MLHQRCIVAQALRRDRTADGEHYHADGRPGLDAQPGLHGRRASAPASGSEWLVGARWRRRHRAGVDERFAQ
jgi:hypothetical protein